MPTIDDLLLGIQTAAVICNQWGDTGKGKYSDYLAAVWADVIARGTGGNNAGHTTVINGKKRIFHLVPAGIVYDRDGKTNILGNGMVIDLKVLCSELDELDSEGIAYNNLMISEDAQVILQFQIERDIGRNRSLAKGNIGSTGRGIGPCYTDKISRKGIFIRDLFDDCRLSAKIKKLADEFYPEYNANACDLIERLRPLAKRIKPFVRDTIAEMHKFYRQGKKILLEGAQGLLLSIEFGTVPYATSSDCSLNGTASGVGLSAKAIDLPLGIVKFPYMTRVGNGPFPSEFGGLMSEEYCAAGLEHDIKFELGKYGIPFNVVDGHARYDAHHENIIRLINSSDPFEKGVGIRLAGGEYGATTGRPRRTGWTDLVALKYAVMINGPDIILTKPDVMQGAETFGLVDDYILDGKSVGFARDCDALRRVNPKVIEFSGFGEDISGLRKYNEAPAGIRESIKYLESATGARVRIMSVGPDQSQNIIIK